MVGDVGEAKGDPQAASSWVASGPLVVLVQMPSSAGLRPAVRPSVKETRDGGLVGDQLVHPRAIHTWLPCLPAAKLIVKVLPAMA